MKGDPEMCVESVLTGVFTCRENSIISCSVPQVGSPRWTAVCSVLTLTDWLTNDWIVPALTLLAPLATGRRSPTCWCTHWRIWASSERRSRIQRALPSRLLATCVTYRTYDRGNSSFQCDRPAAFSFDFRVQHNQKCPVENCGVVF